MSPTPTPVSERDVSVELLAEFTLLMRRSGQDVVVAGAAVMLVLTGLLTQSGSVRDLHGPLGTARLVLLAAVVLGMLRCAALLALTHGRLLHPLSVVRKETGSPARSGWRPYLKVSRPPARGTTFLHVQLLIAAAHDRHYFAHSALRWSFACAGGFALWTVLNAMAGAG